MKTNFNLIKSALLYLPQHDRKRIFWLIPVASVLGVLDLVGVMLLGAVGTLAFKTIANQTQPTRVEILIEEYSPIKILGFNLLLTLALLAILVLICKTSSQALLNYKLVRFWSRIEADLATRVFDYMVNQEAHKLSRFKYSEYQYALSVSTNRYVIGILSGFVGLISDVISTFLLCLLAIVASPASFLSAIIFFGSIYLFTNTKISAKARLYGEKSAAVNEDLNEHLLEDFLGIREIKIFSKEEEVLAQFSRKKTVQAELIQKTVWLNSIIRYLLEISMLLVGILITGIAILLNDARQAITIVVLFIAIGYRLIPNIQRIQNSVISFRTAKGVTEKLFKFLEESAQPKEAHARRNFNVVDKELKSLAFCDVSFSYKPGEELVLKGINFEARSGSRIAIIGSSGSGKSTLLDVLTRVKEPSSGKVVFEFFGNERSSTEIPKIGFVSQNCILFGDDIFEMIAFKGIVTNLERIEIAKLCDLLDLNGLMSKTRSELRSDGTNLSGGERQRIALARALYARGPLMVFDEPTSALDQKIKEKILLEIESNFSDSICIIVTHDPDVLDACTHVIALDQGRQTFFGSVDEYRFEKRGDLL
jgi:ABC-type bacteriocin/lantibiotic exporter with double-glycine peptidase domain